MNIKQVTDAYVAQKNKMLAAAKADLLEHFNKMFAINPAITGVMWTQGIGGEGWDRRAMVGEMQLTTDEDPINADYDHEVVNLYPETTEEWVDGINYDYMNDTFFEFATDYQDSEEMLTDMFPYDNGVKIIVTRDGFHTEDYIY